jgi:hypothetical protein
VENHNPLFLFLEGCIRRFFVLLLLHLLAWLLFQWPLLVLYPLHLIAYFLVGKLAASNALNEDITGLGLEISFAGVGGVAAIILGILLWLFQGSLAVLLEVAEMGGFVAGLSRLALVFSANLPLSRSPWGSWWSVRVNLNKINLPKGEINHD